GVLVRYQWPGNVRELENVIYRSAVIAQGDTILLKDLPAEIRDAVGALPTTPGAVVAASPVAPNPTMEAVRVAVAESSALATAKITAESISSGEPALTVERALDYLHHELTRGDEPILERLEREMVVRVLKSEEGNQLRASEKLGITRATLRKRIEEWGIKL
ncbi:MAG: sigma-54-dependent Fis family transcriptional regulator, partial [Opitutaceae bacterium]|nr:sigma-54-dependent Fis family transcriptional regulator [Opitutaceae bacterium]